MADAYKVLIDTAFPFPLRKSVTTDGVEIEETTGRAYAAGDYVLQEELSQRDQQRADDGELEDFLEDADREEALLAREYKDKGLFIPEHEAERYALLQAGHRVIERDQVLELRSAGAEAARDAMEAAAEGPNDNPAITGQPSFAMTPDLAAVSRGEVENVPQDHENYVTPAELEVAQSSSDAGVEMPPGLPVGPVLAKAEGADPEEVDKAAQEAPKSTARRSKPTAPAAKPAPKGDEK